MCNITKRRDYEQPARAQHRLHSRQSSAEIHSRNCINLIAISVIVPGGKQRHKSSPPVAEAHRAARTRQRRASVAKNFTYGTCPPAHERNAGGAFLPAGGRAREPVIVHLLYERRVAGRFGGSPSTARPREDLRSRKRFRGGRVMSRKADFYRRCACAPL